MRLVEQVSTCIAELRHDHSDFAARAARLGRDKLFPVSVALGLGNLLTDTLERSEPKTSRVLFVGSPSVLHYH
jgi:hypothetical protein